MLQLPTHKAKPQRALFKAQLKKAPQKKDPIFALIEKHAVLKVEWYAAADAFEEGKSAAERLLGCRPSALIAWRNYSHIGGSEIENRRDLFLSEPGADRKKILAEYRDAKARYREVVRRGNEWDRAAGLSPQRKKTRQLIKAFRECELLLSGAKPKTLDGVAALLRHLLADEFYTEVEWHASAIKNIMIALDGSASR